MTDLTVEFSAACAFSSIFLTRLLAVRGKMHDLLFLIENHGYNFQLFLCKFSPRKISDQHQWHYNAHYWQRTVFLLVLISPQILRHHGSQTQTGNGNLNFCEFCALGTEFFSSKQHRQIFRRRWVNLLQSSIVIHVDQFSLKHILKIWI